ncbi:hypothetical protein SARC_08568 [Sphaeroforma arctica JP610]|uniref:Homeobox domain-containing protein n=1 Tax=Sphaeroforma arctica JP610 TaxID=667725 RepID=A0A0L0FQH3_9EUKA|nr:hypothetical protein SARC_08568 [Sphaeroforma arctica JP610]KNC79027.1 hypothetical protein SARC_08568 [Sphaeroforma arctica JP610]|eukprot:XP_014152929.1 hypothetical protein SARC_08568 [Sphaeroforma arctica JP610]
MATQIENALVEHSNCQALNLMEEGDIMCTLSKQQICKGTQILKKWLKGHIHKPYPTTAEKEQLAAQTGNSLKQINYWFINARRRYVPKMKKAKGN